MRGVHRLCSVLLACALLALLAAIVSALQVRERIMDVTQPGLPLSGHLERRRSAMPKRNAAKKPENLIRAICWENGGVLVVHLQ